MVEKQDLLTACAVLWSQQEKYLHLYFATCLWLRRQRIPELGISAVDVVLAPFHRQIMRNKKLPRLDFRAGEILLIPSR